MDADRDALTRPSAGGGRHMRRWLLALLAAVLVAAVLVATQLRSHPTRRAVNAASAGTVPWAALPPTYPHIPRHRVPSRPDPARAAALRPCTAGDLAVQGERTGVAGGTWFLGVTLRLAAHSSPCRLEGHPHVVLLDHGSPAGVRVVNTTDESVMLNYRSPVRVDRGHLAELNLTWVSMWCTAPVRNDRIRVVLGAGRGAFLAKGFGRSPACYGDPGAGPTPVDVSSFTPQHFHPGRTVSAYAGLDVHLDMPQHVRAGHRLDFTVTLTAHKDLRLGPCPDYLIGQYTQGVGSTEDRFALNCRAVPYRDRAGRPYLPAGKPVSFAMHTIARGPKGTVKFLWQLEVPPGDAEAGTVI